MEEFNVNDYGNIDWNIISDILQDEKFIQNLSNQHGAYSPVYDSGLDLPEEIINQNKMSQQEFIKNEVAVLKEKYPELPDNYLMSAANFCSRHYSDVDASMDRDICVMKVTEGVEEYQEIYKKSLVNLKSNLTRYFNQKGNIVYDPVAYSEERVVPIMMGQLQRHLSNPTNPLLTWGASRLALSELSNIQIQQEQQKNSSISF